MRCFKDLNGFNDFYDIHDFYGFKDLPLTVYRLPFIMKNNLAQWFVRDPWSW
jgi:hypothetical protein